MIDLATSYLGLRLKNPIVCSSSPLCEDVNAIRRMEDAGAAAVVLHSLFEEQITLESLDLDRHLWSGADSFPEALTYFPDMTNYNLGPDGYLEHIRRAREAVGIPIIASLNGCTRGGWVDFARRIEEAGADALELNIYQVPTDAELSGAIIERDHVELVKEIRAQVRMPLAVKLGPQYTAPTNFCRELAAAGANGLVLFNRFYQPDFNLQTLEIEPRLRLSTPDELLLRLHWVAILYGTARADLAVTGGVHSGFDVLKVMLAGGRVAMLTSALLKHGVEHIESVLREMTDWMDEREYETVREMQGSMSLRFVKNPAAYERANYMQVLRSYMLRE